MTRAYNTATTQQNSGGAVAGVTAGKNFVINGGLDIWQRGTSFSNSTGAYTADRFAATWSGGSNYTVSRQTSFLTSSRYALRVQRNSGETSTATLFLGVGFETVDIIRLQGKTVTWSFYVKAGSNYSPTSSLLGVSFYTGTGTDQGPFVGHTGEVTQINVGQAITTTGTRYSYTFTVPTNATSARFNFAMVPTGTAGANDFYEIADMQLEIGSVATPFSRAGGTIQGELAACQRYFVRQSGSTASQAYTIFGMALAPSTTNVDGAIMYPVRMRTTPTLSVSGSVRAYDGSNWLTASSFSLIDATEFSGGLRLAVSGATQFRPYKIQAQADSAAYVDYSAEL